MNEHPHAIPSASTVEAIMRLQQTAAISQCMWWLAWTQMAACTYWTYGAHRPHPMNGWNDFATWCGNGDPWPGQRNKGKLRLVSDRSLSDDNANDPPIVLASL